MKHGTARALSLVALIALSASWGCQKETDQEASDTGPLTGEPTMVVAEIGADEITLSDVDRIVQVWKKTNFPGSGDMTERELQVKALDNLIEQELLLQASRNANLHPTDEQVQRVIESLTARYPSPEDWRKSLELQGMNEEEFRENVYNDMAIRQYLSRTLSDSLQVPTAEDAQAYYDSHPELFQLGERLRARHILVQAREVSEGVTPDEQEAARVEREKAQGRIDSLYAVIEGGAEFEQVARDHSDCPSASRGGDLGEFGRGDMVTPFEEAAYALEPGQISRPVETKFGFHIIRLEEKLSARTLPYDDQLQERVLQQLQMERYNNAVRARVEELRSQASITRQL
jgi:peptidyl-prolyl cis-trans isomerase C